MTSESRRRDAHQPWPLLGLCWSLLVAGWSLALHAASSLLCCPRAMQTTAPLHHAPSKTRLSRWQLQQPHRPDLQARALARECQIHWEAGDGSRCRPLQSFNALGRPSMIPMLSSAVLFYSGPFRWSDWPGLDCPSISDPDITHCRGHRQREPRISARQLGPWNKRWREQGAAGFLYAGAVDSVGPADGPGQLTA